MILIWVIFIISLMKTIFITIDAKQANISKRTFRRADDLS